MLNKSLSVCYVYGQPPYLNCMKEETEKNEKKISQTSNDFRYRIGIKNKRSEGRRLLSISSYYIILM